MGKASARERRTVEPGTALSQGLAVGRVAARDWAAREPEAS